MKKGFTLVELLAVIAILAVIALITAPVVNTLLDNAKEKTKDAQIKNLIKLTKDLVIEEPEILANFQDDITAVYVPITYLIRKGYIEDAEVIDPTTKEDMEGCIKITEKYENYVYEYDANCTNNPLCLERVCAINETPQS